MSAELTKTNEVAPGQPAAEVQENTHEPSRFQSPLVDIFAQEDALVVVADMPGLTNEGISVDVEKDVLTLKGIAPAAEPANYTWREYEPTSYFRQFRLGNKIDQSRIAAEYRQGVLRVTLPLAEETKPRQVSVTVG